MSDDVAKEIEVNGPAILGTALPDYLQRHRFLAFIRTGMME